MKMLKKKILLFIVISILMPLSAFGGNISSKNPALKLMSYYAGEIKDARTINPYIVNIIAIYEIGEGRHIDEIKKYILWYFANLNYPDKQELTGSIYDFEVNVDGKEIPTNNYDSVDGYAGTFLYLLNLYHIKTSDKSLIDTNWEKIKDIAYLIPHLQTEDGLTKALPKSKDNAKYLMDNCEAYAGIKAFNELSMRTGHGQDSFYREVAADIKNAVLETLYNSDQSNFYWAIDDKVKHASNWSSFYPDAFAQIFPIYFGLLNEDPKLRKALWQEFGKRYDDKAKKFPLEQRLIYELTQKKMSTEMQSQPSMEKAKPSEKADQQYKGIKGIVLMNGNVIEGQIISMTPDSVKIRTIEGEFSYDYNKEVQRFIAE